MGTVFVRQALPASVDRALRTWLPLENDKAHKVGPAIIFFLPQMKIHLSYAQCAVACGQQRSVKLRYVHRNWSTEQ